MSRDPFFHGSNFVGGNWQNGFDVQFVIRTDDTGTDHFSAEYTFSTHQQGPPGIAHGGAIASLLDEAMTAAAFEVEQRPAFTVNLNITYQQPVPLETPVQIEAFFEKRERRKLFLKAHITLPDGTAASTADGLFILARTDATDPQESSA
jgi:acyl-coenzyme A thioesterase PaaI-like protein